MRDAEATLSCPSTLTVGFGSVVTLDDAVRLVTALPEVTEGTRFHSRTWFVSGKAFAWERPFSKADIKRFGDTTPPTGPILALRTADLQDKEAVLATGAKGFFTIPHFDGFAAILVQLKSATKKPLREAIEDAWLACAPEKLRRAYLAGDRP
jgi:hypothetical protein